MGKIRIGIVGYGNIGRGVEQSIKRNDDMELKAVFTRRDPASVKIQTEGAEVKHFDDMEAMKDDIDVMILCGGSATDLPVIGPKVAASFNTIDSFDTHAKIPEYFANVDKAAKEGNRNAVVFPRARVEGAPYDFSFSGLKSAVLNYINHAHMMCCFKFFYDFHNFNVFTNRIINFFFGFKFNSFYKIIYDCNYSGSFSIIWSIISCNEIRSHNLFDNINFVNKTNIFFNSYIIFFQYEIHLSC